MPRSKDFQYSRPIDPVIQNNYPGPYLARVVGHLDNKFMGSLKVQLLRVNSAGSTVDTTERIITAHYASPFYGVSSWKSLDNNDDYKSTQQSYGMWFVPPDVDTKVLVIFVEGRRDICYWIACVPDDYMNFMIPDGRPATVLTSPGSRPAGSEGRKLPVGEYNKALLKPEGNNQPTNYVKPVNEDFVNILTEQGLLEDDFRGLTSSSARREVPSAVFGINTPGPLDKRPGAPISPRGPETNPAMVYRSRLGGHSLVMDDGDDKLVRKGSPEDSPPEYVELETEGGAGLDDEAKNRPANEVFRIRTRTGHQILLHNTEDLIYISNSRGTAWIELTSNGKIDIYAQDSISLHTEGEFNVTADANINLTSAGDINLNATGNIRNTSKNFDTTAGGRVAFKSADEFSALAGDFIALKSSADFGITAGAGLVNLTGNAGVEVNSGSDVNLISDGGAVRFAAGTNIEGSAGTQIALNAPEIHDSSTSRYIDATTVNVMAWSNAYITGQAGVDIYTAGLKLEGTGTVDVKTNGPLTVSADTISHLAATSHTLGSTQVYIDCPLNVNGDIITANKLQAATVEVPRLIVNSTSSGASPGTYSGGSPGEAAEAVPSAEAELPSPPSKTDGPEPSTPETAPFAPRVPQHEPWFQHENLNPSLYANIRANSESTDTYVSSLPDTFLQIGRNRVGATLVSSQVAYAGPNAGTGYEDEEQSIGTINFNNYTENASAVIAFFEANGYESWVGAGVAGALQWESGKSINPGAWLPPNNRSDGQLNISGNTGLGARGICQWRNAGSRLTRVEKFLGKSLFQQPVTDPNTPGYDRLIDERIPTQSFSSMPKDNGVKVAPVNSTLEDQLRIILWEWDNDEFATKEAIQTINSGSEVQRARRVAEIMNDVYLRSGNPLLRVSGNTRIPVKTLRANSAQELYEAYVSGRSTDPITDPNEFPSPPILGGDPAANARPRDGADQADLSPGANAFDVVTGTAGSRASPIRPEFRSALNRAARDSGIHRILGFSFAGEPLRRLNSATELPIATWGTFPSRADGPGADMQGSGNSWKKRNPSNGTFEFRYNDRSWRVGTERHDTGLAIDCYLQINRGGTYYTLLPTVAADKNKIIEFLLAFSRYGGRGVGVGSNSSSDMRNGAFHLDMLGGAIQDRNRFVRPTGFSGDPVIGWNQRPASWGYGGVASDWALNALNAGFNGGGVFA